MSSPADTIARLLRGVEETHSRAELEKKLALGRPLRVKFGVDPTSPDIHLGHTVPLLKLREFQDAGHLAVLIIGDFTASIGDPTGRNATRPELSPDDIAANAKTYQDQAFKILDPAKTEVVFNSAWFGKMTAVDLIQLQRRGNATQMLQRRDFHERREAGKPIAMHELTYPLLQGWDSVVLKSDVELGGTEQLFNLLIGRDLQEQVGQPPQVVMTLPLLEGLDGHNKMSKSLGNTIAVNDPPSEMFGKAMRISDELMARWYPTLFAEALDASLHPMEAKKQLAARITARFHGEAAAKEAREGFERVFSKHELPTDMPSFPLASPTLLPKLLVEIKAAPSGSQARTLIQQGSVTLDGEKVTDPAHLVDPSKGEIVLKAGKRFFAKIVAG
ncbi:MAG TPA: tyrosine--tRNA ligase [Candidatus Methylacidiphilales bacterium]